MKKVVALVVLSLGLVAGSRWAFTSGADYELRGFSPTEKMHALDTSMIGEKWMMAGAGMIALAAVLLIIAGVFYFQNRRSIV